MTTPDLAAPATEAKPPARQGPGRDPRRGPCGGRALGAARRIAAGLGVILSVITLTFFVTHVVAPDPTSLFLGSAGFGSAEDERAAREQVRQQLGLDAPLPEQYARFLGQVVRGDLGTSFQTGRPVTADLLGKLPATAELAVYSLLLGVALGVALGVFSAVRQGGALDRLTRLLTVGAMATPQFWIGLMLVWVFTVRLHWLPGPIGRLPVGVAPPDPITGFYVVDAVLTGNWSVAGAATAQLVLPVVTLAIGLGAPVAKVVRTSMVEALGSDYVRSAQALGFGARRIRFRYALKNGMLPVVTLLAGIIAFTFVGSVLVEGIFGWPGIGAYSLQAIQTSDFPVIQGFVLYASALYVVVYEALTLAYGFIDPRSRA